jgi:HD-GYP domain-containing protein (c-di-GMP phosphodiesterase class II)
VCDAWHAMTSDRPYRGALTEGEARAELIRNAGTQSCPRTTDALLTVLDGTPAPPPAAAAPFAAAERH